MYKPKHVKKDQEWLFEEKWEEEDFYIDLEEFKKLIEEIMQRKLK